MRSHETLYLYLLAQFLNWTVPPKCMKSVHKNSKFKWVGLCSFHFRLYVKFINWYTIDLFDLCQTRPDQRGCGFNSPLRNMFKIIFISIFCMHLYHIMINWSQKFWVVYVQYRFIYEQCGLGSTRTWYVVPEHKSNVYDTWYLLLCNILTSNAHVSHIHVLT